MVQVYLLCSFLFQFPIFYHKDLPPLKSYPLFQLEIGKVNLKDSYANIKNGELYIYGLHISPDEFGNIYNKDPLRDRKLLVNKREINLLLLALKLGKGQ